MPRTVLKNDSLEQKEVLGVDAKTYYIPPRAKAAIPTTITGLLPDGLVDVTVDNPDTSSTDPDYVVVT